MEQQKPQDEIQQAAEELKAAVLAADREDHK